MKRSIKLISAFMCITMLTIAVCGIVCAEDEIIELLPETYSEESILSETVAEYVYNNGHAYASIAPNTKLYRDAELTDQIATLTGENSIVLVDYYSTVAHIWVADQNGDIICGYVSTKQLDDDYLTDSEVSLFTDSQEYINAVISDDEISSILKKTAVDRIVYDTDEIIPLGFEIVVEDETIDQEDTSSEATKTDSSLEKEDSSMDNELAIEMVEPDNKDFEYIEIMEIMDQDYIEISREIEAETINNESNMEQLVPVEEVTTKYDLEDLGLEYDENQQDKANIDEENQSIDTTRDNEVMTLITANNTEDTLISPYVGNTEIKVGEFALVKAGEPLYTSVKTYCLEGYLKEDMIVRIDRIQSDEAGEKIYVIEYWCDNLFDQMLFGYLYVCQDSLTETLETDYTLYPGVEQ